jgi:uncharacterized RDD family membrane protein YckC
MQTIQVQTTHNVFIHYPVASVGDRILAHLIDRLVLTLFSIVIIAAFINLDVDEIWVWMMVIGTPWLLYNVLFEIFMKGQTPGKMSMKIKVVRLNGTPPSIGDYLLRWIFSFVDFYVLSGAIAVITIAASGKGQRLGDMVAGTSVVKLIEQKEVTASEVFVTADHAYEPIYSQAIQLQAKDIELIQRALEVARDHGNTEPLMAVTEKIKSLLGIQTDLPPVKFLYTVIKDYNHLTSR